MTATNHAVSGALLGAFLPLPAALPLAFCSHFVLDAVPHYGITRSKRDTSRMYKSIVVLDIIVALTLCGIGIHFHKWAMVAAGWAAYAPDILWVWAYYRNGGSLHLKPSGRFTKFHCDIQREYSWGIITEITALAVMFPFFWRELHK